MPPWALRVLAAVITTLSLLGSTSYALAHPKNPNAPLQPPVAEKPSPTARTVANAGADAPVPHRHTDHTTAADHAAADGSCDRSRTDAVANARGDAPAHACSTDHAAGRRARHRAPEGHDHARQLIHC